MIYRKSIIIDNYNFYHALGKAGDDALLLKRGIIKKASDEQILNNELWLKWFGRILLIASLIFPILFVYYFFFMKGGQTSLSEFTKLYIFFSVRDLVPAYIVWRSTSIDIGIYKRYTKLPDMIQGEATCRAITWFIVVTCLIYFPIYTINKEMSMASDLRWWSTITPWCFEGYMQTLMGVIVEKMLWVFLFSGAAALLEAGVVIVFFL